MEIYQKDSLGDKKKQCPLCGSFMDSLATRCPRCGIPMDIHKVQEVASTPKAKRAPSAVPSVWSYLSVIFGLLGGVLGLIFGLIGLGRSTSKENKLMCCVGIGLSIAWIIAYIVIIVLSLTIFGSTPY